MSDRLLIAAALSLLAACVHAGLAQPHGFPLGVGFAAAAAAQTAWTIAAVHGAPHLVASGIAINATVLAVYLASRLGGWEPFAALDVFTAATELALCALLVRRAPAWTEGAGIAAGGALVCLLVSGMAVHG